MTTLAAGCVLALCAALAIREWIRGPRPPDPEYDDLRALQRSIDQRAAMRRACRHREPR